MGSFKRDGGMGGWVCMRDEMGGMRRWGWGVDCLLVGWMRVLRSLGAFFSFYKGGRASSFLRSRSRC